MARSKNPWKKNKILLISGLLIILAIPLTVYFSLQRQNLLGRAQEVLPSEEGKGTQIIVSTNYPLYYLREKIILRAKNQSSQKVELQNSAPWSIEKWGGKNWVAVFNPISLQVLTPLGPGETKKWLWDQKDNQNRFAPSAKYRFNLSYAGRSFSQEFTIVPRLGSDGFFTFNIGRERLRVYMTNPQSVRDAIDNFYKINRKNIPNGLLADDRPGKSPYDRQWSWHLKPESIEMAEMAVIRCEGLPSHVEGNLDYWLEVVGRFCPWSARIDSLQ